MAITRSQIARQLLAEGGVSLDDAKMMAPKGEFLAYINPKEAQMLKAAGGSGVMTPMGIPSFVDFGPGGPSNAGPSGFGTGPSPGPDPDTSIGFDDTADVNVGLQGGMPALTPPDNDGGGNDGIFGTGITKTDAFLATFAPQIFAVKKFADILGISDPNAKFRDPTRDPDDDGDNDNQIIKPMMPIIPKLPTDIEPEKSDFAEFTQRFTLPERFRLAEGGEPRQEYGLGKLVKKVTGAAKKVFKSDAGKAAIAGYFLGGGNLGGMISSRPGFSFGQLGSALGFGKLSAGPIADEGMIFRGGPFSGLANLVRDRLTSSGTGLSTKALLGIGGATAAAAFLTPKQEEEVDSLSKRISDNTGIDVEQIRKEVQKATAEGQDSLDALKAKYPFLLTADAAKADGGRIERAIGGTINEEDEMLDMGGNEMDLRGGGFVPIGEYEKKDDVPARLSKNEFVFTADAVRAAGGGSVDRGADLMYKTMKQLENKVV